MTFDLILVGFGNVARRFAELLVEQRAAMAREGVDARIVGIATKRHGRAYSARGVPAAAIATAVVRGDAFGDATGSTRAFLNDALRRSAQAARQRRLVVVETTTLDIRRGQPAIDHARTALAAGAHVVTANKGPAAFAYGALARAAARAGRRFLFEGAVMDGIPIFNLVRDTLPAVTVSGFRGVVNATTNYILTAMEEGQTFDAALALMQQRGVAEADASFDVDGWDAAAKTAALANVVLHAKLTPASIQREGIRHVTPARLAAARAAGRRLKLVASAERSGRRVRARVEPVELPGSDLLAGLDGQQNAIILQTDLLGEIGIVQRGSGLTPTAYALLSDLMTIARQRMADRARPPARRGSRPDRIL